jgi:hypothetical protein
MTIPILPARNSPTRQANVVVEFLGRSGYISIDGTKYGIEHIDSGHFAIHFPSTGQAAIQAHLDALHSYATLQVPKWYVENRSDLSPQTMANN